MTELEERVAAAAAEIEAAIGPKLLRLSRAGKQVLGTQVLRAAFRELFSNPPTHWLAPWEAGEAMQDADCDIAGHDGNVHLGGAELASIYAAMRDAHLRQPPNDDPQPE